jgi:hypothetical protein
MAFRIEANVKSLPKGYELGIANNLVAVENGGSVEVDNDTAKAFEEATGVTLAEAYKKSADFKVTKIAESKKEDEEGGES